MKKRRIRIMLLKLCLLIVLAILSSFIDGMGDNVLVLLLRIGVYVGMFDIFVNIMKGSNNNLDTKSNEIEDKD